MSEARPSFGLDATLAHPARTPWWYAWVKSWRWRMWLETGIWER